MSIPSFPIYRLPSIPLNDVIKYMDPIALLALPMTSQKSNLIVTRLTKKLKPIHLQVNAILDSSSYGVSFCQNYEWGVLKIVNERGERVSHSFGSCAFSDAFVIPLKLQGVVTCGSIFDNDKIKGLTKAMELLTNTFKVESVSFEFKKYSHFLEEDKIPVNSILTCFKQHKLKMKKICLNGTYANAEFYRFILNESRQASELELLVRPYVGLKYNNFQHDNLNFLKISYASWVTLNNFDSFMNCNSVDLSNIYISSHELNSFLKKWMLREYKVDYIHLSLATRFDFPMIIQGLNAESINEIPKEMMDVLPRHQLRGPNQCYKIQRSDGVKANICNVYSHIYLKTIQ